MGLGRSMNTHTTIMFSACCRRSIVRHSIRIAPWHLQCVQYRSLGIVCISIWIGPGRRLDVDVLPRCLAFSVVILDGSFHGGYNNCLQPPQYYNSRSLTAMGCGTDVAGARRFGKYKSWCLHLGKKNPP